MEIEAGPALQVPEIYVKMSKPLNQKKINLIHPICGVSLSDIKTFRVIRHLFVWEVCFLLRFLINFFLADEHLSLFCQINAPVDPGSIFFVDHPFTYSAHFPSLTISWKETKSSRGHQNMVGMKLGWKYMYVWWRPQWLDLVPNIMVGSKASKGGQTKGTFHSVKRFDFLI